MWNSEGHDESGTQSRTEEVRLQMKPYETANLLSCDVTSQNTADEFPPTHQKPTTGCRGGWDEGLNIYKHTHRCSFTSETLFNRRLLQFQQWSGDSRPPRFDFGGHSASRRTAFPMSPGLCYVPFRWESDPAQVEKEQTVNCCGCCVWKSFEEELIISLKGIHENKISLSLIGFTCWFVLEMSDRKMQLNMSFVFFLNQLRDWNYQNKKLHRCWMQQKLSSYISLFLNICRP